MLSLTSLLSRSGPVHHRVWAHSDATIEALPLDAIGHVAWWPEERNKVSLHRILVHVTAETHRHAGHADIVRELIDGAAGLGVSNGNLPPVDRAWWQDYHGRAGAYRARRPVSPQ